MRFVIRRNGKYQDVQVVFNDVTIDLGLQDDNERLALARMLEEAVDELTEGLKEEA